MAKSKTATATKPATAPVAAAKPAAPAPVAAAKPVAKVPAVTPIACSGNKADCGERQRMIAEAAYYIAEKRGFSPGNHDQDWAEAERQIDAILKKK